MIPFVAPWMLLGFALLAPLIVIMYLLKLKRRPQDVPSTLLWRRSVQDLVANAPFQKLRNNLLLWLQLLILLLLILALARPVMRMAGMKGETIIVLMDLSASMQAMEMDGTTRIERARDVALEAIDGMRTPNPLFGFGARDEMMIIGFADKTMPLQTMTSDRNALRAAVRAAEVQDTETDLTDAGLILEEKTLQRTEDRIEPNPDARVVLISDGMLGATLNSLTDIVNIDYVAVGEARDNLGLTSVEVRESFSGLFEYQVFANVFNSSGEEKDAFVEMEVEGEVLDLKQVKVPPGVAAPVVFTVGETVTGLATLRLVDNRDPLSLDDTIRVSIAPPTELNILLVSKSNPFLEAALAVDPRTTVKLMDPAAYQPQDGYDITVFDSAAVTLPEALPPGSYVFVNMLPPASTGFTLAGDRAARPQIIDWSRVHPITRYTEFEEVVIQDALNFNTPDGAESLVQALESDLIALQETESHRIVVIGFDVLKSYWPVDPSFSIFFLNLIDYWARTAPGVTHPAYATGTVIPIVPPRDSARATIRTPAGKNLEYSLEGQTTLYLTDTGKAGVYDVRFDSGETRALPVNLTSTLESNLLVDEELEIAGKKVTSSGDSIKTRQEIWPWLALLALGVLLAEWAIYCRRTFM